MSIGKEFISSQMSISNDRETKRPKRRGNVGKSNYHRMDSFSTAVVASLVSPYQRKPSLSTRERTSCSQERSSYPRCLPFALDVPSPEPS